MFPLIFMIASAVVQHMQQRQQAKAQEAAVRKNAELQANDQTRQQTELFRQGMAESNDAARRAQADIGLFEAIAGEYGGGRSVDRGRAVLGVASGERMATVGANSISKLSQLGFDSVANSEQSNSRLAAISQPSLLGTALTIASSYAQANAAAAPRNPPPPVN